MTFGHLKNLSTIHIGLLKGRPARQLHVHMYMDVWLGLNAIILQYTCNSSSVLKPGNMDMHDRPVYQQRDYR